ncbi:MAG TPA: hypothetical protein VKB52_02575 [Rhodanobacteraceae bacterium]|nr:hypothetical protein [Rhodanobacteraceae bacterium]
MRPAAQDIEARRAAWSALSDLYLDTDNRAFVRGAARELAATSYSLDDLHAILLREVHPALARNLCATAGVWDRFDQAWLAERILAIARRPAWWPRAPCGRRYAAHLWRLLEPRIRRAREER